MSEQEQEQNQEDEINTVGERKTFKVNVYDDEYEQFGVTSETPYGDAQTAFRHAMGLPERHTYNGLKTSVRSSLKGASQEQVKKALSILNEKAPAEEEQNQEVKE